MDKALPCIQRIHIPPLPGTPLLLLTEGLLVRWPVRVPMPTLGDPFSGTAVTVPRHLRQTVLTLLFDPSSLARCDAARRLAGDPNHRKRILLRIYSRPHVQHMLAGAERIQPEVRQHIVAAGGVPIRRLTRGDYAPRLAHPTVEQKSDE